MWLFFSKNVAKFFREAFLAKSLAKSTSKLRRLIQTTSLSVYLFEKCKISRIHEKSLNCFDSITGPIHYHITDNSLEPYLLEIGTKSYRSSFREVFLAKFRKICKKTPLPEFLLMPTPAALLKKRS